MEAYLYEVWKRIMDGPYKDTTLARSLREAMPLDVVEACEALHKRDLAIQARDEATRAVQKAERLEGEAAEAASRRAGA